MSQNPSRAAALALLSFALAPCLRADPLTESDRAALMEKLGKIEDAADSRVDQRFRVAVAAFRAAMSSDEGVMDLYLKCMEKVQFEDEHKKGQDFREWKRKEADKLSSMAFRRALRHQLQWLVLTMQAASKNAEITKFSPEALHILTDIFEDVRVMGGQQNVLKETVTGTVFAQAYNLDDLHPKDWPDSPLDLAHVYGKVILPPLRQPERIDSLRSAWMKRIQQEVAMREDWPKADPKKESEEKEDKTIGTKEALRPPEVEKFLADVYPHLLWLMEVDVFKAGDQRGASLRMFQHLEKYVAHPKATKWTQQFRALLTNPDGVDIDVEETTGTKKESPRPKPAAVPAE